MADSGIVFQVKSACLVVGKIILWIVRILIIIKDTLDEV